MIYARPFPLQPANARQLTEIVLIFFVSLLRPLAMYIPTHTNFGLLRAMCIITYDIRWIIERRSLFFGNGAWKS